MRKIFLLFIILPAISFSQPPRIVSNVLFSGTQFGGSLFRADLPATTPGVIHTFNNMAPHYQRAGVALGPNDWLYGTSAFNGTDVNGCLFRVKTDGTNFTVLNNLSGVIGTLTVPYFNPVDGIIYFNDEFELKKYNPVNGSITAYPLNSGLYSRNLHIDDGWVYFTTTNSGIAKIRTDGNDWTDMYTFTHATEGSGSPAGLTETPGDTLFGVNQLGGANDKGTIYSIKKDGTGFAVHHTFNTTDGAHPESRLVYFDGKLYGTTNQGGTFGAGVIFTIKPDGSDFRIVHHFITSTGGGDPFRDIFIADNGRILGAFSQFHTVSFISYRMFKVDTSGADFQPFFQVDQREAGHFHVGLHFVDGNNIYVTTQEMGRHNGGVISFTDSSGFATSVYHFGMSPNGFNPGPLIKSSNGRLYGTTLIGGATGNGVIYSIKDDGSDFQKLHEFSDAEGYEALGKLLEASDGKLYGTLRWGGPTNQGAFYRIDTTGANFELLHHLNNPNDAYNPMGSLVEDAAGFLYGTTFGNFSTQAGTVFRINKNGTGFTVLHTFNTSTGIGLPLNGVVLHQGFLYGTASNGGPTFQGGVFRIGTDGTNYLTLHDFSGTEGSQPTAAPMIASNGRLYGTTSFGGTNNWGTIYSVDLTGSNFTILRHFDPNTDGGSPVFSFVQATDGLLYGNTFASNLPGGGGTIYRIDLDGNNFTLIESFDINVEGQAGSGLVDLGALVALPVQWLSFTGTKKDATIVLNWRTAKEVNADVYEVERSADGTHFQKIGTVLAAGNTNNISAYQFIDQQPFNGANYYRLKQVDRDRSFEYSKIIRLNFSKFQNNFLYPNPASDFVNVRLSDGHLFNSIKIFDGTGRVVRQQAIDRNQTLYTININALPKGWYNVVLNGEEKDQQSFIKN